MDGVDVVLVFYLVLAACAVLLIVRAVVAVLRVGRVERPTKAPDRLFGATSLADEERISIYSTSRSEPPEETAIVSGPNPLVVALRTKFPGVWFTELCANLASFSLSFTGKVIFAFSGTVTIFGLLVLGVVYVTLSASLTEHALHRARDLAAIVRDDAPAYPLKANSTRLRGLLRRVAKSPGVAYVMVEDRHGIIISHSLAELPDELQKVEPFAKVRRDETRVLSLVGEAVYEVRTPVSEGAFGAVRVALWKNEVDADVRVTVVPMIRWIAFVALLGIVAALLLGWLIMRPIARLVRTARWISLGELDAPSLGVAGATEFGELSRALERIRSSVKAALVRLDQEC